VIYQGSYDAIVDWDGFCYFCTDYEHSVMDYTSYRYLDLWAVIDTKQLLNVVYARYKENEVL